MRYVLCPGYVISKHDGDKHFIDAPTLANLYRIPYENCVVYCDGTEPDFQWQPGDIPLNPRFDGNYAAPLPPKEKMVGPMGETMEEAWKSFVTVMHPSLEDPGLYCIEQAFWMGACGGVSLMLQIGHNCDNEDHAREMVRAIKEEIVERLEAIDVSEGERLEKYIGNKA